MSKTPQSVSSRQMLDRRCREGFQGTNEIAVVTSPGARTAAWTIKVKSHSSYNIYNVIAIVIGNPGSEPSEIGQQMQAVNLAESFTEQGTLPPDSYAIMVRVGGKNVFYAEP
jgi:hypothetical protein